MGVRDLIENKHATSEDSSDAFHRVDHHYEGDENAHCGDGEGSHDDEGWCDDEVYRDDEGSNGHNGARICQKHGRVLERAAEHVVARAVSLHDHAYRSV